MDIATLSLLAQRAGERVGSVGWEEADAGDVGILGERQIHQATGMLIAQLGVGAEQAFARLRAHAYAEGKDMLVIAEDIIARRLRLEPDSAPGADQ
jgi:hypothetical protein